MEYQRSFDALQQALFNEYGRSAAMKDCGNYWRCRVEGAIVDFFPSTGTVVVSGGGSPAVRAELARIKDQVKSTQPVKDPLGWKNGQPDLSAVGPNGEKWWMSESDCEEYERTKEIEALKKENEKLRAELAAWHELERKRQLWEVLDHDDDYPGAMYTLGVFTTHEQAEQKWHAYRSEECVDGKCGRSHVIPIWTNEFIGE